MAMREAIPRARTARPRPRIARFIPTREVASFPSVVATTRPWLVSMCTSLLSGDRHAAEDVSQEVYLRAYRLLMDGGSILDIRGWLSTVARNACIDHMRRNRAVPMADAPEGPTPEDETYELEPPLEAAWTSLQPRQRELIFLREFMGMSYREIAEETAMTVPAVEAGLFRARASLRRGYRRAGGHVDGLAWLGLAPVARLLANRRSLAMRRAGRLAGGTATDRWVLWAQGRVGAFLARLPLNGSLQSNASAAGVTAVAVLAAGLFVSAGVLHALGPTAPRAAAAARPVVVSAPWRRSDAGSGRPTTGRSTATSSTASGDRSGSLLPLLGDGGGGGGNRQQDGRHDWGWRGLRRTATFTASASSDALRVAEGTAAPSVGFVTSTASGAAGHLLGPHRVARRHRHRAGTGGNGRTCPASLLGLSC